MTAVNIPQFILGLVENEIIDVVNRVVDVISKDVDVSSERLKTVVKNKLGYNLVIIPPHEEELRITKMRPRKTIPEECKCQANVKKAGIFRPCSFAKCAGSTMYCTRHFKKFGDAPPAVLEQERVEKGENDKQHKKAPTKLRKVY